MEERTTAVKRTATKTAGAPPGNSGTVDEVVELPLDEVVEVVVVDVDETVVLEGVDVVDAEETVLLEAAVELDEMVIVLVPPEDAGNSTSLLFEASATQRFPDESKAIPCGAIRLVWLVAGTSVVNDGCPKTNDALAPVESGTPNSSTLSFPVSATQRSPKRSNAIASGKYTWV
jgi:hypothetical protein